MTIVISSLQGKLHKGGDILQGIELRTHPTADQFPNVDPPQRDWRTPGAATRGQRPHRV